MKRIRWRYLLFIPAVVIPLGITWSLWIQDGGILSTDIRGFWFYLAIATTGWAVAGSLKLIAIILNWTS